MLLKNNDKQTPPPSSVSFDPDFMDDAECAEYNENNNKKILRSLFFWVIVKNSSKVYDF